LDELSIKRDELRKAIGELRSQREMPDERTGEDARLDQSLQAEMLVQLRRKEAEVAHKLSQVELKTQKSQGQKGRQGSLRKIGVDSNYNWEVIGDKIVRIPILTEKEIKRRLEAFEAAYKKLKTIMREHPGTPAARKARAEIMVAISHLRSIHAYNHAAAMLEKFIRDNPQDGALAQLELSARMDYLAWARTAPDPKMDPMDRLAEIAKRFKAAREKLAAFAKAFPEEKEALKDARRALADSFLDEARLVSMLSPARSRGRYVSAAEELLALGQSETAPCSSGDTRLWPGGVRRASGLRAPIIAALRTTCGQWRHTRNFSIQIRTPSPLRYRRLF
jgi:tetratricopeptide (TPR) repeat protein